MPNPVGERVGVRGPIKDHSLVRKWLLTCVGLTGLNVVSPPGLQRSFESVVREGEEELLAHPERLAALAAEFGSEILGDYPNL